ncbi:hypothetical protein VE03_02626 [Pseudogymnoascus sp. 23342-1-I1]|nr:hypothetical protein VE03_02626 [Pseudogymnoascus sp. 23342-1-I1]
MKFSTILFGLTAVVSGVLASPVGSPVGAPVDAPVDAPLAERANCAYDSCVDCQNFCYRDKYLPCPQDHYCGVLQLQCIALCITTNCCKS